MGESQRAPKTSVRVRGTLRPKQVTGNKPVVDEIWTPRHTISNDGGNFSTVLSLHAKSMAVKGMHDGKGISMYRIIIVET